MKKLFKKNKLIFILTAVCSGFALILLCVLLIISALSGTVDNEEPVKDTSSIMDGTDDINGVWIASVYNINFPSQKNLSADDLRSELDSIVETTKAAGMNTIFFQVRPESDALYDSGIFPVSSYLSDSGELTLDALEYLIDKAHGEDITVHAWINPVRVTSKSGITTDALAKGNPARENPEYTVTYADGKIYYNLGIPEVRKLICRGVEEIVENYDVDGIVFDDYFYPYPSYAVNENGESVVADFGDREAYAEYNPDGLDISDWRRENVNLLVEQVYDTVKKADADVLFGVSPFGIWKNGYGDGTGSLTSGSESYSMLYCDTLAWIEGEYVDYIAPQLYWTSDQENASYDLLCDWWAEAVRDTKVRLLISHGAYRYDNDWADPSGIMTYQVNFAKKKEYYRGSLFYGYAAIKNNINGITDELTKLYGNQE